MLPLAVKMLMPQEVMVVLILVTVEMESVAPVEHITVVTAAQELSLFLIHLLAQTWLLSVAA
jgi:hypothetical protein